MSSPSRGLGVPNWAISLQWSSIKLLSFRLLGDLPPLPLTLTSELDLARLDLLATRQQLPATAPRPLCTWGRRAPERSLLLAVHCQPVISGFLSDMREPSWREWYHQSDRCMLGHLSLLELRGKMRKAIYHLVITHLKSVTLLLLEWH